MPRRRRLKASEWLHKVDVQDFLETLDIMNISQARTDELKFSCPFSGHSHGDENPSAYMNTGVVEPERATKWKCHGCNRSGNAISFLSEHEDISKFEAATWLRREYASDFRSPKGGTISAEFEQRRRKFEEMRQRSYEADPYLDEACLYPFAVNWDKVQQDDSDAAQYLIGRGFEIDTLKEWEIGYDATSERWVIPVRDKDGLLVGFKARAWREGHKPKYLVLGGRSYDFSTFDKSHHVFGLHRAAGSFSAIICEGELNVIAMNQMGLHNAISISGSSMSDRQAKLIRDHFTLAYLFLDHDNAGHAATWGWTSKDGTEHRGIVDLLEPFMKVYIVGPHEGDPADMMRDGKDDEAQQLIDNAEASTNYVAIPDSPVL